MLLPDSESGKQSQDMQESRNQIAAALPLWPPRKRTFWVTALSSLHLYKHPGMLLLLPDFERHFGWIEGKTRRLLLQFESVSSDPRYK